MKYLKGFNENEHHPDGRMKRIDVTDAPNWIDWPLDIAYKDYARYERMITFAMEEDDIDDRMVVLSGVLAEVEEDYPDLYDSLEDSIKDVALY